MFLLGWKSNHISLTFILEKDPIPPSPKGEGKEFMLGLERTMFFYPSYLKQ